MQQSYSQDKYHGNVSVFNISFFHSCVLSIELTVDQFDIVLKSLKSCCCLFTGHSLSHSWPNEPKWFIRIIVPCCLTQAVHKNRRSLIWIYYDSRSRVQLTVAIIRRFLLPVLICLFVLNNKSYIVRCVLRSVAVYVWFLVSLAALVILWLCKYIFYYLFTAIVCCWRIM
jgi:hypothetical protein